MIGPPSSRHIPGVGPPKIAGEQGHLVGSVRHPGDERLQSAVEHEHGEAVHQPTTRP
jgi:hypothetical protein